MQTVATLAERLDMSPEEAVEKLRHMTFEVDGVDAAIDDELCDLLFEIDDDPGLVEKVREERLEKKAKLQAKEEAVKKKAEAKKRAAAKKKAAAAKKKTVAVTKKATAKKKPAAKKKAAAKKKSSAKSPVAESDVAEILPDEDAGKGAEEVAKEAAKPAMAEILPDDYEPTVTEKDPGPAIVIGTAIDHEEHVAEIVRADGTHVDVVDVEISETDVEAADSEDAAGLGLLAKAERVQHKKDQEESRRAKERVGAVVTPDPKVVADVIRKAEQKQQETQRKKERSRGPKAGRDGEYEVDAEELREVTTAEPVGVRKVPAQPSRGGSRKTGKTARKRQKKMERLRRDEDLRRSAAAAVREYQAGGMDGGPKKRRKKRDTGEGTDEVAEERIVIQVDEGMSVELLAEQLEIDPTDILLQLMERSILATKNQLLSIDVIREIAAEYDCDVEAVIPEEEDLMVEEAEDPADLEPRAPVITVMGHVDHGKTSLLDQVRKASVAAGEAGGITQHIAAYEVELSQGRAVFLDTPGHEAFTAMRARGAQITDVVVLVVAADDGIMPQTREAIDHARAADVPIVVAVNKCDKPDAQPDRIRQELGGLDLLDEKWGGKTIIRDISALNGDGISELMELLVLETELLELKANPNKPARGIVVEAEITRGQGPVAWVLVRSGTLRVGDIFLCGRTYGRVRAMVNSSGENVTEAGPSTPVVVMGFNQAADAGDQFVIVKDERVARSIANKRTHQSKLKSGPMIKHVTLEDFYARLIAGEKSELNVVIKADVQGSVDVLESTLPGLGNEEVKVRIVHSGVGPINESDVLLASASDAVVFGFHVEPTAKAEKLAQNEGVDIRTYLVIYEMTQDIQKSLEGMLTPDQVEVVIGHAEIRQIFRSSALGAIAGCMQTDGEVRRDSLARVLRNDEVVYEGRIGSLRRDKDQVNNVQSGFECGIKLHDFDDIAEGDIIEAFRVEEVAKTLA